MTPYIRKTIQTAIKLTVALLLVAAPLAAISQKPIKREQVAVNKDNKSKNKRKAKTDKEKKDRKYRSGRNRKTGSVEGTSNPSSPIREEPEVVETLELSLAADLNGQRRYFTEAEWAAMPREERIKHDKIGLVVSTGKERFLLGLTNNMANNQKKVVPLSVAINKTGGQLPSEAQTGVISRHTAQIDSALLIFGGETLCLDRQTDREKQTKYLNIWNTIDSLTLNDTTGTERMFRICTTDIESGFRPVIVSVSKGTKLDFVRKQSNNKIDLITARHKDKYGFLNEWGYVVVPFEYDAVGCNEIDFGHGYNPSNDNTDFCKLYELLSVSKNGKWGMIDKEGEIIIPIVYDAIAGSLFALRGREWSTIPAKKDGFYGCINKNNEITIPFEYEEPIKFTNYYNTVRNHFRAAKAQKNGKWGVIRDDGSVVIDFLYDDLYSYESTDPDEGTNIDLRYFFEVHKDGKFGFMDTEGNIIIPIKYPIRQIEFQVSKNSELMNEACDLYLKKNYKEAYDPFVKCSDLGDALAMSIIGDYYFYGWEPCKKSYSEALKWYNKAISSGYATASMDLALGKIYETGGDGISIDLQTALDHYVYATFTESGIDAILRVYSKLNQKWKLHTTD